MTSELLRKGERREPVNFPPGGTVPGTATRSPTLPLGARGRLLRVDSIRAPPAQCRASKAPLLSRRQMGLPGTLPPPTRDQLLTWPWASGRLPHESRPSPPGWFLSTCLPGGPQHRRGRLQPRAAPGQLALLSGFFPAPSFLT